LPRLELQCRCAGRRFVMSWASDGSTLSGTTWSMLSAPDLPHSQHTSDSARMRARSRRHGRPRRPCDAGIMLRSLHRPSGARLVERCASPMLASSCGVAACPPPWGNTQPTARTLRHAMMSSPVIGCPANHHLVGIPVHAAWSRQVGRRAGSRVIAEHDGALGPPAPRPQRIDQFGAFRFRHTAGNGGVDDVAHPFVGFRWCPVGAHVTPPWWCRPVGRADGRRP
jgi:hypothetical protein